MSLHGVAFDDIGWHWMACEGIIWHWKHGFNAASDSFLLVHVAKISYKTYSDLMVNGLVKLFHACFVAYLSLPILDQCNVGCVETLI
jgi:hypothetical protein